MPYKDKEKDREWHREKMRERRSKEVVTPPDGVVTPNVFYRDYKLDADGNPIYGEE